MDTPHDETEARIRALLEGEDDWVAAMSTVACELHQGFDHFHWTGFYRTVRPGHLKVGPYQGGHGCLDIPFERGICGAAARTKATQDVPDVHARPEHIACSSSTNSEVVVPVLAPSGEVVAATIQAGRSALIEHVACWQTHVRAHVSCSTSMA